MGTHVTDDRREAESGPFAERTRRAANLALPEAFL